MFLSSVWKWVFSLVGITGGVGLATGGYFLFSNLDKYKEFVITPISNSPNDMVTAYFGAKLRGAEAILAPGYTHQTPIEQAFESYLKDEFSDLGFLLYDSAVTSNKRAAANTWNITYRADLGSIEVGIAAAYFLNYYQDVFLSNGKDDSTLSFAMWGGQPYSSVTSFMGGFQKGIDWANENLVGKEINGFTYMEVKQIYSSDGQEFTGGFGASQGISLMSNIIKQRPDILMPVAGPQVWTAQDEIEKLGSKTVIIGVDSAIEDDPKNKSLSFTNKNGEIVGNGKRVQFSSLKNLDLSTQIALEIINNGNKIPKAPADNPDRYKNFSKTGAEGEDGGFGTIAVGDLTNRLVGVSDSGKKYYEAAYQLAGITSPANDPIYNEPEYMQYVGYENTVYSYANDLQKEFKTNNDSGIENLVLKGFITKGDQDEEKKIKVALSTAESILMDSSFSQSCYTGLYYYFKSMDINIPAPIGINGGKN